MVSERRDIDFILEEVVTLPSLPRTVAHISSLVSDPDCSLSIVAKAISADPSIAMKTLRLVNAAFYGLRQKVSTVEHAVVLLGLKVIKNLVFTATVFDTLKTTVDTLLSHSIGCGVAMRVLVENGKKLSVDSTEEAFIYGLLHDIGMIVFEQFMPEEFATVNATCIEQKVPRYEAERAIIGCDHAMIGARLAQKWKLPSTIVDVVAGHHDLAECEDEKLRPIAATLSVADYLCTSCGMPSYPGVTVRVDDATWAASGLSSEDMPRILGAFFESRPSIVELIQLAR
ncbi:MAG TPA: HDOD domain-containing protein [Candidatus Hydrogenedentes bacterium]|nr:HDOD domain-containing protein [Candidatus Hydrogenedentota bacterium]HPG68466.1 HDOD domain-containing protein [Candidatus Hydrogenedentota bacterium]